MEARFPDHDRDERKTQMRVALLTTPQGAFVSHHLIKHLSIVGVAVDVGTWVKPPAMSRLERLERIYHRQGVKGVLVSLLAKAAGGGSATGPADRARAAEARYLRDLDRAVVGYRLYEDAVPLRQFPTWADIHGYYNIPVIEVDDINSEHAVNTVAAWQPDLCIVIGGRVLKGPILSVARSGVLNKHSSLLPRHRGLSGEYWCLYHEDFDALGVTIHYVVPGLDAGPIVLQRSLEFRKGDTPDTLRHRSELLGRDLLVEAVRLIAATGCTGTPQDESRASRNPRPTLLTDRTLYGKLPDLWKKYGR
jgi:methionyl-tRNA formyltransferase